MEHPKIGAISIALIIVLIAVVARADDGVFYASGNTLIPLHETTISLKKEILKLKRDKGYLDVDVYFEFDNPGKPKKETVGFVTPVGGGFESDRDTVMPFVSKFTVTMNGANLKWKLSHLQQTGFHLPKCYKSEAKSDDFVFFFSAEFKAGMNTIHHTYRFKAGGGQSNSYEYLYRLITGTSWANKEMEDFTLIIDMGPDSYFYLPQTFWKSNADIPWKIEGEGVMSQSFGSFEELQQDSTTIRMVKLHSGTVSCHLVHFRPDYDLGFAIPWFYNLYWWTPMWGKTGVPVHFAFVDSLSPYILDMNPPDSTQLAKLTLEDLSLLKNLPFAFHDCVFADQKLNEFFSQFNWYLPYAGRTPNVKYLTHDELALIAQIKQEETRRQKR